MWLGIGGGGGGGGWGEGGSAKEGEAEQERALSLSSFLNHELMTGMDTKRTSDEWIHPRAVAQWGRPTDNEQAKSKAMTSKR